MVLPFFNIPGPLTNLIAWVVETALKLNVKNMEKRQMEPGMTGIATLLVIIPFARYHALEIRL
jgi:hypothetical protein